MSQRVKKIGLAMAAAGTLMTGGVDASVSIEPPLQREVVGGCWTGLSQKTDYRDEQPFIACSFTRATANTGQSANSQGYLFLDKKIATVTTSNGEEPNVAILPGKGGDVVWVAAVTGQGHVTEVCVAAAGPGVGGNPRQTIDLNMVVPQYCVPIGQIVPNLDINAGGRDVSKTTQLALIGDEYTSDGHVVIRVPTKKIGVMERIQRNIYAANARAMGLSGQVPQELVNDSGYLASNMFGDGISVTIMYSNQYGQEWSACIVPDGRGSLSVRPSQIGIRPVAQPMGPQ